VGVVLVRRIVKEHDVGPASGKDRGKVCGDTRMSGLLHIGAGVGELDLDPIFAETGCLSLLLAPNREHLLVRI
jgi:hypothetical protein